MAGCPSRKELLGYLSRAGALDPDRVRRIEVHVEQCPACQGRLDRLGDAGPARDRVDLVEESEPLSASAIALLGRIRRSIPRELEQTWGPGGVLKGLAHALDGWGIMPSESAVERARLIEERLDGLLTRARHHYDRGRYAEAEPLYRRVLVLRASVLPAGHPDVARSLNQLATVLARQGRYAEAEPLYRQALAIRAATLPERHPDLARSLLGLAAVCARQGRFNEAATHYQHALSCVPDDHPDGIRCLLGLKLVYMRQGRHAEAGSLDRRARALRSASEGLRSPPEPSADRDSG